MSSGLKFRKIDLHVHTSASHDFRDIVTPEQIVDEAIKKGLEAIAVTDHNTAEGISSIQEVGKQKGLVIFPGAEISCTGGKHGIHIVAIFDPNKNMHHVNALLAKVGIPPEDWGKPEAQSPLSVVDAIAAICEAGGIAVPAHVNSEKGVCADMQGQQRLQIIRHPQLLALEATDFSKEGKCTADFFDGYDPNYKRKLAVYQASDNPCKEGSGHCLEGIGTRATYFKLDQINLEGLRQCFVHPEARIRIDHENHLCHRIVSLKVNGEGFFGGQAFDFNNSLNSIIGGKGVGKSLVVELLRFGLHDVSLVESLKQDHHGKLKSRLLPGSSVEVVYQLPNGESFKISREYSGGAESNHTQCVNLTTGENYKGDISTILPIIAYSQTEVIQIAGNKRAQLDLIDRFVATSPIDDKINKVRELLIANDVELSNALTAESKLEQVDKDAATLGEQIEQINKALSNELFGKVKYVESVKRDLEAQVDFSKSLVSVTASFMAKLEASEVPKVENEIESLNSNQQLLNSSLRKALQTLSQTKQELTGVKERLEASYTDWLPEHTKIQSLYQGLIRSQGGDKTQQEAKRKELEEKKTALVSQAVSLREQVERLSELQSNREQLLDRLDDAYQSKFEVRKDKYEALSVASENKLRLILNHSTGRDVYKERLVSLLSGSSTMLSVPQRKSLADSLTPRELVAFVLERDVASIAENSHLSESMAQKVIDKLLSRDLEELLELQHTVYPEDVPQIQFRKTADVYAELHELSVGQKCTALLIIALLEGKAPVLIDQPEDALDIVSVWEDVSKQLLKGKYSRQFILTTHNSTVSVSSDTDQFIVINATADKGEVVCSGAIDRDEVKRAVLDHLEGGNEPYLLRKKKYNL